MPSERTGPLADLRVLEIAGLGPGPYAALILAELGADVVRVDRPGGGAETAASGLDRSRRSIAVDLKQADGVAVLRRLAADADVLVEGLRPGVMERLGLGPDVLLEGNPRLVYARMTGWGQDGPYAAQAGHDITYAAVTGALHAVGPAQRPLAPLNVLADFAGGTFPLLVGILAALHSRQSTGRGQVIDAAMVDGAASLMTMFHGLLASGQWRDERAVNLLDGGAPFYDTYACADGTFVAVGALEPQFWAELNARLGLRFEHAQNDPAGFAIQRAAYAEAFATRTRAEWVEVFAGSDACVAPVLSLAEAPDDPHLRARGVFADVGGAPSPRIAPRFSGETLPEPEPGHRAGTDTRDVLRAAGFAEDEIDGLLRSGAVHES